MENIKKLLQEVNVILQKEKVRKEESRKRGERFNMFEMLGVAHYEVTHSKIIAGFLNPQGSHGQGDLFLRLFLQTIENKDEIYADASNAKVYTEYGKGVDGRLDIFIEIGSHSIIIENKVYAGDQPEQLKRYNDFAKEKYGEGSYMIYYLTLYGHEASEDSVIDPKTGECVNYNCISYSKDINNWLQLCIQESATMPLVRETLVQYLNHIKQLTNQDMDRLSDQEWKYLLSNKDNFKMAMQTVDYITHNINSVRNYIQAPIIESWKNELENMNFEIEILKNPKEYDDRAIFVAKTRNIHTIIGWSHPDKKNLNFYGSELYCQAEYDSYFRAEKKIIEKRPERDRAFNDIGLVEFLPQSNVWCNWKRFGFDYDETFDCFEKVIEKIIQHKETPLSQQ
ncbi:MAG: PD-(D/E)XK nuclease family protein [Bacteroidales bacterium]|nr:PD-(D/E)XK nuclease family protein [Bacteroidales bacterium]